MIVVVVRGVSVVEMRCLGLCNCGRVLLLLDTLEFGTPEFLSSFALGDDAFDFVESAIGARRTMFDDIAANLACSAALACLGSTPLNGPIVCVCVVEPRGSSTTLL
jgi:hypothetical protein